MKLTDLSTTCHARSRRSPTAPWEASSQHDYQAGYRLSGAAVGPGHRGLGVASTGGRGARGRRGCSPPGRAAFGKLLKRRPARIGEPTRQPPRTACGMRGAHADSPGGHPLRRPGQAGWSPSGGPDTDSAQRPSMRPRSSAQVVSDLGAADEPETTRSGRVPRDVGRALLRPCGGSGRGSPGACARVRTGRRGARPLRAAVPGFLAISLEQHHPVQQRRGRPEDRVVRLLVDRDVWPRSNGQFPCRV